MKRLVWLASYPKSGNTWLRAVLANLRQVGGGPADINELGAPIASGRDQFDAAVGLESSDLLPREVAALRADVFRHLAAQATQTEYLKVHDAYVAVAGHIPFPAEVTLAAIYIVRNPLDVALSFANHSGISVQKSVERLCDPNMTLSRAERRLDLQFPQPLLDWSGHARSWLDEAPFPVHLMRYEDMLQAPLEQFRAALAAAGEHPDEAALARAVERSSFGQLKAQEQQRGFKERTPQCNSFFNQGRAGRWRKELTEDQVRALVSYHGPMMRRLGYLSE